METTAVNADSTPLLEAARYHPAQLDAQRATRLRIALVSVSIFVATAAAVVPIALLRSASNRTAPPSSSASSSLRVMRNTSTDECIVDTVDVLLQDIPYGEPTPPDGFMIPAAALLHGPWNTVAFLARGMRESVLTVSSTNLLIGSAVAETGVFAHIPNGTAINVLSLWHNDTNILQHLTILTRIAGHAVVLDLNTTDHALNASIVTSIRLFLVIRITTQELCHRVRPSQRMSVASSEVNATGTYLRDWTSRGTQGLEATGWYQSDASKRLVTGPAPRWFWVNLSASWSYSNASGCGPVAFGEGYDFYFQKRYDDLYYLGTYRLLSVVGARQFPEPLDDTGLLEVDLYSGFDNLAVDGGPLLAAATTEDWVANNSTVIVSLIELPSPESAHQCRHCAATYFDKLWLDRPHFDRLPAYCPTTTQDAAG